MDGYHFFFTGQNLVTRIARIGQMPRISLIQADFTEKPAKIREALARHSHSASLWGFRAFGGVQVFAANKLDLIFQDWPREIKRGDDNPSPRHRYSLFILPRR
ncbi:MAG: hypothetical protein AB1846_07480 [Chloroflexota bacterium]